MFMGTNFILSIFMVGMLQFLWGLINTLQMIMFTVLLSVDYPVNCFQIMIAIMKLTNLDVINTQTYIEAIFTFKVETEPFDGKFEEAGYESSNFILELGTLFFIISASVFLYLVRKLCQVMTQPCGKNCLTDRVRA